MKSPAHLFSLYDDRARIPFDGSTYAASVERDLAPLLQTPLDARILDVGCGLGWHLQGLQRRGFRHLWGIDGSGQSLRRAADVVADSLGETVSLVQGDFRTWDVTGFFDLTFSFLACFGAIDSAHDRGLADAFRRTIKPGGRVVVTTFNRDAADRLVGSFSVSYAIGAARVETTVGYDAAQSRLLIRQHSPALQSDLQEDLFLYSAEEFRALFLDAGFSKVSVDVDDGVSGDRNGVMRLDGLA